MSEKLEQLRYERQKLQRDRQALAQEREVHAAMQELSAGGGSPAKARRARIERLSEDPRSIISYMSRLRSIDVTVPLSSYKDKLSIAMECAEICAKEFSGNQYQRIPSELSAADNVDANLNTLSGTVVAQKTLENFVFNLSWVKEAHTDFSDKPGALNQNYNTRIIVNPAVLKFDPTINGINGIPNGWSNVVKPQTVDVNFTMDELIGVPIRFDLTISQGTARKIFKEFPAAASYVLAEYFSNKLLALCTPANFNAYAAVNGVLVPQAYPTLSAGVGDVGRSLLTKAGGIFSKNKVPTKGRFALFNIDYAAALANDPTIIQCYGDDDDDDSDSSNVNLPRMSRFRPYEVGNLTEKNATPNLVGFFGQRAALAATIVPPVDLNKALGIDPDLQIRSESQGGSSMLVTDPITNLTMMIVMINDQQHGYSQWQLVGICGAGVGDNRGGLCLVSP